MVQLAFLLSASLALLLSQHQVFAQRYLPAGQHTLTVYKKHYSGGSCRYIYYVDNKTGNPKLVDNVSCGNYGESDHSFEFKAVSGNMKLLVVADCTDGESIVYIPRTKVEGVEGPGKTYEEIFSGPICVKK